MALPFLVLVPIPYRIEYFDPLTLFFSEKITSYPQISIRLFIVARLCEMTIEKIIIESKLK